MYYLLSTLFRNLCIVKKTTNTDTSSQGTVECDNGRGIKWRLWPDLCFVQLFGLLQGPWQDECGGLPCQIQRNGFGYSPPVYRDVASDAPGQAWPAITNLRSLQPYTLSTLWQVWMVRDFNSYWFYVKILCDGQCLRSVKCYETKSVSIS